VKATWLARMAYLAVLTAVVVGVVVSQAHMISMPCEEDPMDHIGVLEPGDIILTSHKHLLMNVFMPGDFSHAMLFYGYVDGEPYVVHATRPEVRFERLTREIFEQRHCPYAFLRVKGVAPEVRLEVVEWARSKVGLPYDRNHMDKQVEGGSYYCSELVWAAYMAVAGVDIDANPGLGLFPFTWNSVTPQEIYDDDDTEVLWEYYPRPFLPDHLIYPALFSIPVYLAIELVLWLRRRRR